jgi:uncharacterized protein (DUF427 family)
MRQALWQGIGELRYEPTEKRVRAVLVGVTFVDSTRAVLVWEPRRVVPSYAVPRNDLQAQLKPVAGQVADDRPILDPRVPFAAHSTAGTSFDVVIPHRTLHAAAFAPDDPALDGHVVLDFEAFDTWYEEDDALVAHPRDPYHRVDVRQSSRHVRIELDGRVLAESSSPSLVFETNLPTRFYLPHQDVRVELRGQVLVRRERGEPRLGVRRTPAGRGRTRGQGRLLRRPGGRDRRRGPAAAAPPVLTRAISWPCPRRGPRRRTARR